MKTTIWEGKTNYPPFFKIASDVYYIQELESYRFFRAKNILPIRIYKSVYCCLQLFDVRETAAVTVTRHSIFKRQSLCLFRLRIRVIEFSRSFCTPFCFHLSLNTYLSYAVSFAPLAFFTQLHAKKNSGFPIYSKRLGVCVRVSFHIYKCVLHNISIQYKFTVVVLWFTRIITARDNHWQLKWKYTINQMFECKQTVRCDCSRTRAHTVYWII